MAVEDDQSTWLPTPPPPRPARRDAAIEAALRKFDGVDESVRNGDRATPSWVSTHRPQLSLAMSVALIVIIGVPAAIIGFREQPPTRERTAPAPAARYREPAAPAPEAGPKAEPTPAAERPPVAPPPASKAKDVGQVAPPNIPGSEASAPSLKTANEPAMQAAPAPVVAAPEAPPPPPPPPPASVASAVNSGRGEIVVTGSIMRRDAQKPSGFDAMAEKKDAYGPFLSQLQKAVRADDRNAVVGLVDFPLRVNAQGTSQTYRGAQSVERDYDRIFTAKVRRAILKQRADKLFVRDQGAMIGDGEVWFDHTCPNTACSPLGPVRIKAVNP